MFGGVQGLVESLQVSIDRIRRDSSSFLAAIGLADRFLLTRHSIIPSRIPIDVTSVIKVITGTVTPMLTLIKNTLFVGELPSSNTNPLQIKPEKEASNLSILLSSSQEQDTKFASENTSTDIPVQVNR